MVSLAENRKARFDFELMESYEAGIALIGIPGTAPIMGYMLAVMLRGPISRAEP